MFHIYLLVLHKQMECIAATKQISTAAILNNSEGSGPPTNGKALQMCN